MNRFRCRFLRRTIRTTVPVSIHIVCGLYFSLSALDGNAADNPNSLGDLSLEDLMKVEVATVTTASKQLEKTTAAPAMVMVISAKDIRLRGYSTLKDVLRDLPGMETSEYYFSEIGTLVPVRGIVGNNKIVVLVNGMRVNPPGGENFPFRSDFSVRNAEQIEVIYGPGSTLYGQDAISAVINVKTQRAEKEAAGEIGVEAGSQNTREGWASAGTRFGDKKQNAVTASVFGHDSDLMRLDREFPAWWTPIKAIADKNNGLGAVPNRQDYGRNSFARLEGKKASLQFWQRQSRRSSAESGYPQGYLDVALWEDTSNVMEGRHSLKLSRKASLDSSLTFNEYKIDPRTRYVFPVDPNHQWFLNDFKYGRGRGFSLEETLRAQLKPNLSLLAGIVASDSDIIPKATIPGGARPGDIVAQGGSFTYFRRDNAGNLVRRDIPRVVRSQYQNYGAYLEMGWQASRTLKTTFGARFDRDSRFGGTPFSPRVAAVYDINNRVKLKYIFTRAYVAPAPYFANAVYDNGTLLATANPNLQPETATAHEVNLSYSAGNSSMGASIYRGQQSNLILISDRALPQNIIETVFVRDANGNLRPRTLVQTANGGNSRNLGADLFGRATFGRFSTWVSYSYVNFEATNGIATGLAGISTHNVRLGGTFAATPKFFVTPSLVWRSTPQNVTPGVLADELKSPWEINLHAGYTAGKNTEIFVDVRNLTDRKYALGGISGFAVPQETRSARLGIRHAFR